MGAGVEWPRRLQSWQGGKGNIKKRAAGSAGGGGDYECLDGDVEGKVVFLTMPCTTLESFVETKVCYSFVHASSLRGSLIHPIIHPPT